MKNEFFSLRNTLLLLLVAAFSGLLSAQNATLSIQGVLRKADGNAVTDGPYSLTFQLWDARTGGTAVHIEKQDNVQITGGIYSTLLGKDAALNAPFDKTYFLGVTVGGGQELIPRAQLSSAPYTLAIKGETNIFPSNGNVGVGTLTPGAKMEVSNGTTRFQIQPGMLDGAANDNYTTLEIFGGKTLRVLDNFSVSDKVAIGSATVAPDAGLFVNDNIRVKDDANIYGLHQLTGFNDLHLSGDPAGGPDISISAEGYVGIGASPGTAAAGSSKLSVSGGISVDRIVNVGRVSSGFDLQLHGNNTNGNATMVVGNNGVVYAAALVVNGLGVTGAKSFVVDHPLDPANKVLTHFCVEGPDAYNLYQGMVTLDADGFAWVTLPDYYEALNVDSRYQLTCVGAWAQVYVAEEVRQNRFRIGGGKPGMKVSWQVTGTRNDPWMRDNKPAVERMKKEDEVGTYFYAKGYGQPAEKEYLHQRSQMATAKQQQQQKQ